MAIYLLKIFFHNIPNTIHLNSNSVTKTYSFLNNYVLLTTSFYLTGPIYLQDYFTFPKGKNLLGFLSSRILSYLTHLIVPLYLLFNPLGTTYLLFKLTLSVNPPNLGFLHLLTMKLSLDRFVKLFVNQIQSLSTIGNIISTYPTLLATLSPLFLANPAQAVVSTPAVLLTIVH